MQMPMENLLDSQIIEPMNNDPLKENTKNKEISNLLSDLQQEITQTIIIDNPNYKDGHYYYPIINGDIIVNRRYAEFELLSEYLFKTQPQILQKTLPQKEFGILYLISFVQENTQILRLRKQKFQIYINDIKNQLPNNKVVIEFLQNQKSFFEQMVNIDYSLIQSQSNFEKIKRLYEMNWFKRNSETGELEIKRQLLERKILYQDQILSQLVILYLNLQYKTKTQEIQVFQNEVQELMNNIIRKQDLYQDDLTIHQLQRLTIKIREVIELFQNVRPNLEQYNTYEKLLDDCLKLIIFILQGLQK